MSYLLVIFIYLDFVWIKYLFKKILFVHGLTDVGGVDKNGSEVLKVEGNPSRVLESSNQRLEQSDDLSGDLCHHLQEEQVQGQERLPVPAERVDQAKNG